MFYSLHNRHTFILYSVVAWNYWPIPWQSNVLHSYSFRLFFLFCTYFGKEQWHTITFFLVAYIIQGDWWPWAINISGIVGSEPVKGHLPPHSGGVQCVLCNCTCTMTAQRLEMNGNFHLSSLWKHRKWSKMSICTAVSNYDTKVDHNTVQSRSHTHGQCKSAGKFVI